MLITNNSDISLDLAVWALHDEYDRVDLPNYISVTTMMKPVRHIVLPTRIDPADAVTDIEDFLARAMGRALHDSVERAWTQGYIRALTLLGYTKDLIERVRINPTDDEVRARNDLIPIYLEQRLFVEHRGFNIGGKFDLVTEGIVKDNKSTSAYTWKFGGRDEDHTLQMSLYRWLDSKQPAKGGIRKIHEDFGQINYIFTDFQKAMAKSDPSYPQKRVEHKQLPLMSLKETEDWVNWKLDQITVNRDAPEPKLPDCTDEELWISEPTFKYYADPTKTAGRSTKNFPDLQSANAHLASKGGKGVVKTVRGEPKRCGYCDAFALCTQKDRYFSL